MKKSKKIYIFAIVILAVILTVFFAGCTPAQIQVNRVEDIDPELGDKAFEYLQALSGEELSNRTLGTQGALDSAKYIANILDELGYQGVYSCQEGQGLQEFKTTFKRFDNQVVNDALAYNVVFKKQSTAENSKGEIILSCSYDNLYAEKADVSGTPWKADGSYESGASVAVMLTLAEALKDLSCDYDLTFAFFTGGCYGWKGAMNYVDNLDRAKLDNIALVINFAMLGGGDIAYIYTGEGSSDYGAYLNECASNIVTAVPNDKNIGQFIISDDSIYNYSNIGMLSNQYFFDIKSIPTANVLSLNWEINDNPLITEMKGKDNVYHTQNDTLQNMIARKGDKNIKSQLFGIIKATLTALDESNQSALTSCLGVAREQLPNAGAQNAKSATLVDIIFKVVIILALVVTSYFLKNYLRRVSNKYLVEIYGDQLSGEAERDSEPFATGESNSSNNDDTKQQNTDKKQENIDKIDPFA